MSKSYILSQVSTYLPFFLSQEVDRNVIDMMLLLLASFNPHGGIKTKSFLMAARKEALINAHLRENRDAWMETAIIYLSPIEPFLTVHALKSQRPSFNTPKDRFIIKQLLMHDIANKFLEVKCPISHVLCYHIPVKIDENLCFGTY